MRGRNRSNKGPNPLTRAYESNGPDVKIRGTAQHIAEKYAQLARDAQASGDPVMAENYFQHGEHYYRIISAANEQYRQQYGGNFGRQGYDDDEEGDDEGAPTNGYAPQERGVNGYAASGYGAPDDYGDPGQQPQPYDSRDDRPSRFDRQDRQERQDQRQDRPDRQERRERFQNRQERQQRDRQDRPERQGGDRQDLSRAEQPRPEPGRQEGPRQDSPRPENLRQDGPRQDGPRQDGYREGGRSEFRRERRREEPRSEPVLAADEPTGLPAFLTTPVRPVSPAPAPVEDAPPPPPAAPVEAQDDAPAPRPRRRRRTRFEGIEGGAEPSGELFPKPAEPSGE
ncbi:DUF4167 domain-containing protein [Methylobacterium nonmethylotrophicum]|uniref:DUF4167 domain-containing protein n=1 Tax=Methylobacterium nonmethylotrophicum TaxID=1141884 RepID=A0A4Z0NW71_9HYPH|nr:DUF4167 domain-containing protein [Methylobacterium nonmethylotrophicum]TGE01728.1 DUF4167 domain-containing protein [Methylobacterium nonmethylotrophicum]